MSTETRAGSPWLVATLVILAAGILTLILRPGDAPPAPLPPAGASGPAAQAEAAPVLDWPDGPDADRSFELSDGEAFELRLDSGDVEVLPGEDGAVRVRVEFVGGTRPPASFSWTTEQDGQGTRIKIRSRSARGWFSRLFHSGDDTVLVEGERVKASGKRARVGRVQVTLPPGSPLRLHCGAGDLRVSDRSAAVSLRSGAGDVTVLRVAANVSVETGAGDVQLEGIAGDATIESGAGDVVANGILGRLEIQSGAGSVSFAGAPASVTVHTGAGGVEGELLSVGGAVAIQTGMGGIVLRLPPGASAELSAASGLGSVSADIEGTRLSAPRGQGLTATLGAGGPQLNLRTGTGSIRVSDGAPPRAN